MDPSYTRDDCLTWIKDPEIDPIKKTPIYEDKSKFKLLRTKCQKLLTVDDIKEINEEMLPIIFPQKADIKYQLSPLDDHQEKILNQTDCSKLWSPKSLLERIKDDRFIKNLLQSEKHYLKKKLSAYKSIENHPEFAIGSERYQMLAKSNGDFSPAIINDKRDKLNNFINQVTTLSTQSRCFVRSLLCQRVWAFSVYPEMVPHQIIMGSSGSGCTKIAQLFASLYYTLGLVNNDRLVDQFSVESLDNTLCLTSTNLSRDLAYFIHQFRSLFGLVIIITEQSMLQKMLPIIRKEFPHTITLPSYDGSDLAELMENMIKKIAIEISENNLKFILGLIEVNYKTFTCQAKDISLLAQNIIQDYFIVKVAQKGSYDEPEIFKTFQKYFLIRGQYVRLDDNNTLILNPIGEITPCLRQILTNNLLTREQLLALVASDDFIHDVIDSKQKLLVSRLAKYQELLGDVEKFSRSVSVSQVRYDLKDIIESIDSITGDSRENVRRFLYSQIYLFTKTEEQAFDTFFNFSITSRYCSEDETIIKVISHICEQVGAFKIDNTVINIAETIDPDQIINGLLIVEQPEQKEKHNEMLNFIEFHMGLCGIIMSKHNFTTNDRFVHLFPNCLVLLPRSSDELSSLCLSQIDKTLLIHSQSKYIRLLINTFNQNQGNGTLFYNQDCDMLNLARDLQDDLVGYSAIDHTYGENEINHTFQKFFQEKGLYIDFIRHEGGGTGGTGANDSNGNNSNNDSREQNILTVLNDARKSRLKFFN